MPAPANRPPLHIVPPSSPPGAPAFDRQRVGLAEIARLRAALRSIADDADMCVKSRRAARDALAIGPVAR